MTQKREPEGTTAETLNQQTATPSVLDEKQATLEDSSSNGLESGPPPEIERSEGPTASKYLILVVGLMLSAYLVTLDKVIVATALPVISSKFDALDQAPWIATAFLVTQAGFSMAFGQLLTVMSNKWVYFSAITIFEVGNLICGVTRDFTTLLVGRGLVGLGSGGMLITTIALAANIASLEQRPLLFALFGIMVALANISGPLIGGALTDHVSWRWCFFINLPLGALNMIIAAIFLDDSESFANTESGERLPLWKRALRLDWVGNGLCFGAMLALLYPLQGGGILFPWSAKVVIILFCLFGLLSILFVLWEYRIGSERAVLPLILFTRRTTVSVAIEGSLIMLLNVMGHFFLPIYYQASLEHSAVQSGVDILPYMVAIIFGTASSGAIIKRTGLPWPFLFVCPLVTALASGLIFWAMRTSPTGLKAWLVVLQIAFGASTGAVVQQTLIYGQAEYRNERRWIPQVSAMMGFSHGVGSVIGVSLSGAILGRQLRTGLSTYTPNLPPSDLAAVLKSVTAIRELDVIWREGVTKAYSEAAGTVFLLGIPSSIVASLAALFMNKYNLKE